MNEFDRRWKQATNAARSAPPREPEADGAPFGFAERLLRRREKGRDLGVAALWQAIALRTLGTVTLALLLLLTYEGITDRPDDLTRPELESAVVDSLALP